MNIYELENAELGSVVFVRNYVQLVFENSHKTLTLTIFNYPEIKIDDKIYKINNSCYRDQLCSFINQTIKKVEFFEENKIKLFFSEKNDKNIILISLLEEETKGYEAAMLSDGINIIIW